jgi:hypothetical protein
MPRPQTSPTHLLAPAGSVLLGLEGLFPAGVELAPSAEPLGARRGCGAETQAPGSAWARWAAPAMTAALVLASGFGLASDARAACPLLRSEPGPTAPISYQGYLTDNGKPASGTFDFEFRVHAPRDVTREGTDHTLVDCVEVHAVEVRDGLFTALPKFWIHSLTLADGEPSLQVLVRPGGTTQQYEPLGAKQPLAAVPLALALPGLRTEPTSSVANVIGGSRANYVKYGAIGATIAGGGAPKDPNSPLPTHNEITGDHGTIGGGAGNKAGRVGTVGGGVANYAEGYASAIGGGRFSRALGDYSTVAGGSGNHASGSRSFVGGGLANHAFGTDAVIAGGYENTASGEKATVPGGYENHAGAAFSFAAGHRAHAQHNGSFVWSDTTPAAFASTADDQFLVQARGGVGIGTNAPKSQLHVAAALNSPQQGLSSHVMSIENNSTDTSYGPDVLALQVTHVKKPGANVNYIVFRDADGVIGEIDGNGRGGVTYASKAADFAEHMPRRDAAEILEPGSVVGLQAGRVGLETRGAERIVVVSTAPLLLGNTPGEGGEGASVIVALLGQVPVRVQGPVRPGDIVLASGRSDGSAVARPAAAVSAGELRLVVGRALEGSDEQGLVQVSVLVGLSETELLGMLLEARDARLARVEAGQTELRTRLEALQAAFSGAGPDGGSSVSALDGGARSGQEGSR